MPEPAEPTGAVIEGVIQVEQQGRAGFEQFGAGADCGGNEPPQARGIGYTIYKKQINE